MSAATTAPAAALQDRAGRQDYAGLVAVVTGGASGIGLATAEVLAARGASVATLDRQAQSFEPGADASRAAERSLAITADVRSRTSVETAVSQVVARWGRLDIVVNNAGIEARGSILDHDDEEWARVLDVNVVGMARVVRAALPYLRESPAAAVVNTCSVAALRGMPGLSLYSASKGAVLALTRALAADLVSEGVRVSCVCPGTVDTPWVGRLLNQSDNPDAALALITARQPDGRLVTADEVALAIAFLASPAMRAITGVSLPIDGGISGLHIGSAP